METRRDKLVVAVDGPAGSGKSTIARRVAKNLGYCYIDTGAMFRAMTWLILSKGISLDNRDMVIDAILGSDLEVFPTEDGMGVCINGSDVTEQIRTEEISTVTSKIAALPEVREHMFEIYRGLGINGGVVIEGRDIGTVAFPDAELKIYLTAGITIRAGRRLVQNKRKKMRGRLENIVESIRERDKQDSSREHAPLARAHDAIEIDTTLLTIEQVTQRVAHLAHQRIQECTEVNP